MTEEIRPICLYVETCLDRKEGTRDCAKCEHHLNYWTEVMIRDMEKNIKRLEQENKELKEKVKELDKMTGIFSARLCDKYRSALEEINKIAEPRFVNGLNEEADQYNQCMDRIQNKINEVLK